MESKCADRGHSLNRDGYVGYPTEWLFKRLRLYVCANVCTLPMMKGLLEFPLFKIKLIHLAAAFYFSQLHLRHHHLRHHHRLWAIPLHSSAQKIWRDVYINTHMHTYVLRRWKKQAGIYGSCGESSTKERRKAKIMRKKEKKQQFGSPQISPSSSSSSFVHHPHLRTSVCLYSGRRLTRYMYARFSRQNFTYGHQRVGLLTGIYCIESRVRV